MASGSDPRDQVIGGESTLALIVTFPVKLVIVMMLPMMLALSAPGPPTEILSGVSGCKPIAMTMIAFPLVNDVPW